MIFSMSLFLARSKDVHGTLYSISFHYYSSNIQYGCGGCIPFHRLQCGCARDHILLYHQQCCGVYPARPTAGAGGRALQDVSLSTACSVDVQGVSSYTYIRSRWKCIAGCISLLPQQCGRAGCIQVHQQQEQMEKCIAGCLLLHRQQC